MTLRPEEHLAEYYYHSRLTANDHLLWCNPFKESLTLHVISSGHMDKTLQYLLDFTGTDTFVGSDAADS